MLRSPVMQNTVAMGLFLLIGGGASAFIVQTGQWQLAIALCLLAGAGIGMALGRGGKKKGLSAVSAANGPKNLQGFCAQNNISPREADVLRLLATGARNKEIAERLYISESTAKTHTARIFEKTGCRNRAQLAALLAGIE